MTSVFISYRSSDRAFVLHLADSLKQNGHDVWLDQWRITGRDPYWDEIQRGIESVRYFIFVISPDSVNKESNNGARKELYHAAGLANGPIIVPVLARETPFSDLPIVITPGMYQIHDFVHLPYQNALLNVLAVLNGEATAVNKVIKIPPPVAAPSPVAPVPTPKKSRSRLPLIGAALAIILIVLLAGYKVLTPSQTSTPTQVAAVPSATNSLSILATSQPSTAAPVTATARPASANPPTKTVPTAVQLNPIPTKTPLPATALPTSTPSPISPTAANTSIATLVIPIGGTYIKPKLTFVINPNIGSQIQITTATAAIPTGNKIVSSLSPAILNALLTPGTPAAAGSSFSGPKLIFFAKGSNTLVTGYLDADNFYQLPKGGDSSAADWTQMAGTTNGLIVFYNQANGAVEVGHVDDDGTYKILKTPGIYNGYTGLIGLTNQRVMFYKRDTALCTIERVETDGTLIGGYSGPCAANAAVVTAMQDGQTVVFYNQFLQQITVAAFNSDYTMITEKWFGHTDPAESWVSMTDVGSDRILLYAANGVTTIFQVTASGSLNPIATDSNYSTGWTHILNTNGAIVFYNAVNGASLYGTYGSDSQLAAGQPQKLNDGWMLIASTR